MEKKTYDSINAVFNDDPLGLLNNVGDILVDSEIWNKEKTQSSSKDGYVTRAKECYDYLQI